MLHAVLFVADPHLAALLKGMAGESAEFAIEFVFDSVDNDYAVARALNTRQPEVVLVEMTNPDRDLPVAAAIRRRFPELPLVGLTAREYEPKLRSEPGHDSVAVWPFSVVDLEKAISDAVHKRQRGIYENLVSFLPGKAGSGASTVALHTAQAAAHDLKSKVLLMEADLHSGLLSAMLNVLPRASIREALAAAPEIDIMAWHRYVTSVGGVDFLLADPSVKEPVPHWTHYLQLLRFAAPRYGLMMVDLPEVINSATAEAVRRSRTVYVVTTPEFASLKLAKQRGQELEHWGVDPVRIRALVNRQHRTDISAKEAELLLGYPVAETFPNDYKTVQRAVRDAAFVGMRTQLGEAYLAFSRVLTGNELEKRSMLGGLTGLFRR